MAEPGPEGRARALPPGARERRERGELLPLFGVPFAIKDNIDFEGVPTTAGCPAYAFVPATSAPAVERLIAAGAIPIGKTNLDQFATGLVGTRSPYGACPSAFDAAFVGGGSSSGSALAVAHGLVSFSLGTDTAGSGRVPAAFNDLVGLKPTRGLVSTRGVVPACRSLDCVSVFATSVADARRVLDVIAGFDAEDPFSRSRESEDRFALGSQDPFSREADNRFSSSEDRFARGSEDPLAGKAEVPPSHDAAGPFSSEADGAFSQASGATRPLGSRVRPIRRLGVPAELDFLGNTEYARLFDDAVERARALGFELVPFDASPFVEAGGLLYDGPWVAERYAAVGAFLEAHAEKAHAVVRQIILGGRRASGADVFGGLYRLAELRRRTESTWRAVDALLFPTVVTHPTLDAVERDPLGQNTLLGRYTNFVNLLDLSAIAIPAGFTTRGLPFGVTLMARAFSDARLCEAAERYERAVSAERRANAEHGANVGRGVNAEHGAAVSAPSGAQRDAEVVTPRDGEVLLAVAGAHLRGQPLNHELTDRGARFVQSTRSAPDYRLFALRGTTPPKPGLVRAPGHAGPGIELEVWALTPAAFGSFVAAVPPPMVIGTIELADGARVKGFLCEPFALDGALDITHLGGFRAYLAQRHSAT
nr:MAG: allophanate hydrolase [Pseudomonadota bacterium]